MKPFDFPLLADENIDPEVVEVLVNQKKDIAVGGQHACALTEAGTVVCWGRSSEGQTTIPGE